MQKQIIRRIVLLLALLAALAFSARAQTPSANRWLVIVDTSLSMERYAAATQNTVQNLWLSGMSRQLRPGDTIGMWTFNEELYTGNFKLQVWLPEQRQILALRAVDFLKTQRYEKVTRYTKVIPALNLLVTNSDILTVILITDGAEKITGTPFDTIINNAFKQDSGYQKRARAPFIVTLRAQGGKFVDFTVTFAPWSAIFPPLPPEPELVKKTEPETLIAPTPAPTPTPIVPALIVTEKKPEPVAPPESVPPPVEKPAAVVLTPEPIVAIPPVTTVETKIAGPVPENPPVFPKPPTKMDEAPKPAATPPAPPPVAEVKPVTAPPVSPLPDRQAAVVITSPKENIPPASPNPQPQADAAPAKPAPVQAAVITPTETSSANRTGLLIGLALVLAALAIGFVWLRRPRHAGQASLITRSLDKEK